MTDYIYRCPNCDVDIASGRLSAIRVICPVCKTMVVIAPGQKIDLTENPKFAVNKTFYGRDRLTIDQMHSSAAAARKAGHKYYFTGIPCKNGHIAPRRTVARDCYVCFRSHVEKYTQENRELVRKRQRDHRRAVRQKALAMKKKSPYDVGASQEDQTSERNEKMKNEANNK